MSPGPAPLMVPVEIQVRELDPKILLSAVAAERGFPVIMGSRMFLHLAVARLPRGVYLAKSLRHLSTRIFGIMRRLGHVIVAHDEESLVRPPDAEYYRWRLSEGTVSQVGHLLAWGPDDAGILRAYPGYRGAPIHVTGNPRMDLMRPELREYYRPEVEALRARFGDFVLVNTNFNKVNHFFAELSEFKNAAEAGEGRAHPFEVGKGRHKLALLGHFREMVPRLCRALADRPVVLRPHPEENHAPWQALARQCPNLRVINEGNVVPWLLATRLLVANSCTTMVEAAVLDRPAINFEPVRSDEYDYALPNSLSYSAKSADDVCELARAVVRGELGPLDPRQRRALLEPHLAALDGPLAADRMVDVVAGAGYLDRRPPAPPGPERLAGWLHAQLRTARKRLDMGRPGNKNNLQFHAHRFPPLGVEEVRDRLARLGQLLDRFHDVRVEPWGPWLFRFGRAGGRR